MAQATTPLTENDNTVLSLLFDPEASQTSSAAAITIDPTLPDHPTLSPSTLASLRRRELIAIKKAERAISITTTSSTGSSDNNGEAYSFDDTFGTDPQELLNSALSTLQALVSEYPSYPGGWNNLAQLRRVRMQFLDETRAGGSRGLDIYAEENLVERHLKKAIELSTAATSSGGGGGGGGVGGGSISTNTAKTLQASYNQLGVLYLSWSKSRDNQNGIEGCGKEALENGAAEWEERASWAFGMAGKYGSELGRTMAARTNPYAKMCAGMVREAMKMEITAGGVF